MKYKIKKRDGKYGLLTTRDENSAQRYCIRKGVEYIGPTDRTPDDTETLDQTTGEIVKRPKPIKRKSELELLNDRVAELKDEIEALRGRISALETKSVNPEIVKG